MPAPWFRSLRSRFLLLVLLGAVLPLAVTGAWLTQSAVRFQEGLLRAQLDTSLATIAARVADRWSFRRGDILGLAGNEVATRTVGSRQPSATVADSDFMARTYDALRSTMARVRMVANDGSVRWTFGDSADGPVGRQAPRFAPTMASLPAAYVADTVTITQSSGARIGMLITWIRLSAILPADSVPILVTGAQLTVADNRTGQLFQFAGAGSAPRGADRFTAGGHEWIAVHRTLTMPAIELTVAAPAEAYVGPFERSARIGLLVLLAIIVLVVILSIYSTGRITGSLERLVSAADAVAAGDLERNVDASGRDEVGRLGMSFNTMTQSLRRTLQELSHREALAAVGEFAASLSHEVRNGLSAVRVDLQRVEEAKLTDDVSAGLVTRALRNTRRLDTTVTGALAVARSGRVVLDPVELDGVLVAASAAAEGAFTAAGATLALQVHCTTPCSVSADAAALEQLFLNLLLNAAQAMPPGGRATVDLTADHADCMVTIRDSGPGMAIDELARAMQPFHSSKPGGTGLGLSIARKIAEVHGGSLDVASEPGEGTVVRVRLPRRRPGEDDSARREDASAT